MRQCPAVDNFLLWKLKYCRMGIKPVLLWKRTKKTSLQQALVLGYLIAFIH